MELKIMKSDSEIMSTFDTVKELRPQLEKVSYVEKINRLNEVYQYNLVALIDDNEIKAVAGFRINESLAWGNISM